MGTAAGAWVALVPLALTLAWRGLVTDDPKEKKTRWTSFVWWFAGAFVVLVAMISACAVAA